MYLHNFSENIWIGEVLYTNSYSINFYAAEIVERKNGAYQKIWKKLVKKLLVSTTNLKLKQKILMAENLSENR